jgi:electron transport complex protein RnfG
MIKVAVMLTIVATIAGLAIGVANDKTKNKIAEQQELAVQAAIETVFPKGVRIVEMRGHGTDVVPDLYWLAFDDSGDTTLTGYAFEMSGSGYEGDIKFVTGIGVDGKILGITVLVQSETPGLGSRITEVASTRYIWNPFGKDENVNPWFTEQFKGISSLKPIVIDKAMEWHRMDKQAQTNLRGRNAVTAVTGSTITTAVFTKTLEQKATAYLNELGGFCCPATKKKFEDEQSVSMEDGVDGTDDDDV